MSSNLIVRRYTGQESQEERQRIADNPPDILLTNFMMAELLLTRQEGLDTKIIDNATGLNFIVSMSCTLIADAKAPMLPSSFVVFATAAPQGKRRSASALRPPWPAKDLTAAACRLSPTLPLAFSVLHRP